MANRPAPIRKAEIQRIVNGVIASGLSITRIDVEGGKVVIHTNEGEGYQESPLEEWRRKHGQG
jgi:predicted metal-dependent RNase